MAGDHGMKPRKSVWLGRRWREWRSCVWEILFQAGWPGLLSIKRGAGHSYALSFFFPYGPLLFFQLPTCDLQGRCEL